MLSGGWNWGQETGAGGTALWSRSPKVCTQRKTRILSHRDGQGHSKSKLRSTGECQQIQIMFKKQQDLV